MTRAKLETTDFQLHSACRAATWDDKRPIGAYISTMHIPALRPISSHGREEEARQSCAPDRGEFGTGF